MVTSEFESFQDEVLEVVDVVLAARLPAGMTVMLVAAKERQDRLARGQRARLRLTLGVR